jgi:plastocyanin
MIYSGTLIYDASENIQLVTLRGPIGADEKPAKTWTPDGDTIFELTFVDPKNAKGEWAFSGNALAVHTMKTTEFTVDYKILDLTKTEAMVEESKTVELEEKIVMEDTTPAMEEPAGPTTHTVDIPAGTSVPGCEETNACYLPADITINAGDTVEWINIDTAAHTVTGGSPADGPSGVFDSSLVMADAVYAFTFNDSGNYDYFCMVHPWMVGTVSVN